MRWRNPFLSYAALNLGYHADPVEEEVSEEVAALLAKNAHLDTINQIRKKNLVCNEDQAWFLPSVSTASEYNLKYVAAGLISKNTNRLNEVDHKGEPVVHRAAYGGRPEIMRLLIEKGADLRCRDGIKNTPLIAAAVNGSAEMAKMILDKARDTINFVNVLGKTALHDSAERKRFEVVKLLIQYGCDVHMKDNHGRTSLSYAAGAGSAPVFTNYFISDRPATLITQKTLNINILLVNFN